MYLVDEHELPVRRACESVGLSRSAWYRPLVNWAERDGAVIGVLSETWPRKSRGSGSGSYTTV